MQKVEQVGSVRVDLLGGTIDLSPIQMILSRVVTINLATTLQARVTLEEISSPVIVFESLDYARKAEFSLDLFQRWDQRLDQGINPLRNFNLRPHCFTFLPGSRPKISWSPAPTRRRIRRLISYGSYLIWALAKFISERYSKRYFFRSTRSKRKFK